MHFETRLILPHMSPTCRRPHRCACLPRRSTEFESDAKAKVEELSALLAEREEEFYAYQNAPVSDDDDYDDEDDEADVDAPKKPKAQIDSIDYADDEDEEDDKDEM